MSPSLILERAGQASAEGRLLAESVSNLSRFLQGGASEVDLNALGELVAAGNWKELDNRFFKALAFGTGGLRGKSISGVVTAAERGEPRADGRPQFPCAGTNAMNFYNVSRATQGLVRYLQKVFPGQRPKVCVCYDTRFFSREFAELAARVITEMGCDACLMDGPRSTPHLSFAVRYFHAQAGINITASHNPPEYNGYKVYFEDGGQVVEPHASGIIAEVHAVESARWERVSEPGTLRVVGPEVDAAYLERLRTLPIEPELLRGPHSPHIVFTPLHGVGGVMIKPALESLGVRVSGVAAQEIPDGRFPTVASPNPENPAALTMAIEQAEAEGADLVVATDPDADRLGVAARDAQGRFVPLTGNQTGSLLCWHRISRLFAKGILHAGNAARATVIKTFVTTDLQAEIARRHGIRCVETLTGFKYIGEKLRNYEMAIPEPLREGYREKTEDETRALRLAHSTYYVFGGEESYGYSASDFVRDKDANSAAILVAEAAAYAASQGMTLISLLDRIFAEYGVYLERNESLTMEGAEGAARIRRLVESYTTRPPQEAAGRRVARVRNFSTEDIVDSEGVVVPKEPMIMLELEDGRRAAIRPSGTEPKIKFYLFAVERPPAGRIFQGDELDAAKARARAGLDELWAWLESDCHARVQ